MRQIFYILLAAILLFSLCACGTNGKGISLDQVTDMSQEELEEKLLGLSQAEIHEMWGQPDSMLSGLWGDIYLLPDGDQMIIVYYESEDFYRKDGHVSAFKIAERQIK